MDGAIQDPKLIKLTRTARIELAFPLDDRTWAEIGVGHGRLGVLRSQMHRMLNAGITGLFANKHLPESKQRNALAYVKDEIAEIEKWAAGKKVDHLRALRVPGNITDAIQSAVNDKVAKFWKDKGKTAIPSFKEGAPIMVRDGGWELKLDEQGRFTYSVKLWDGRGDDTWVRFAVRATKDWHYSLLKRIATDPTVKNGSCQIVRDMRRKKWYALLAFTTIDTQRNTDLDPSIAIALNRGRHNFLYAAATLAGKHRIIWPGDDLLRMKQRVRAQRWERKRKMRVIGDGARGRGIARRYREYEALGDYEARYVHTVCQRSAAEVVKYAEGLRSGRVLIEDFGGVLDEDLRYVPSWPWYQLKTAIGWACKKAGIELVTVDANYVSTTCPRCGNVDAAQHNLTTGTFHCRRCEFDRPADLVATINMLDQAGEDVSGWRNGFEDAEKFARALREGESPNASGGDGQRERTDEIAERNGGARKPERKPAKAKGNGNGGRKR